MKEAALLTLFSKGQKVLKDYEALRSFVHSYEAVTGYKKHGDKSATHCRTMSTTFVSHSVVECISSVIFGENGSTKQAHALIVELVSLVASTESSCS